MCKFKTFKMKLTLRNERFFELRREVLSFMEINYPVSENLYVSLKNEDFILDLAFLTDISKILNDLNLTLQSKNKHIFNLITTIKHFDLANLFYI